MEKSEPSIFTEILVNADPEEVWEAWTTEKGIISFFAPACEIEIVPEGKYEIYFDPEAPTGKKGGEGLRILAVDPLKMLSFTWNAPPSLPKVRDQRTHVIVRIFQLTTGVTKVTLHHDGWGTRGEWDDAFKYFNHAWSNIVLPRLKYRFDNGPIDWSNPPKM